MTRTSKQTAIRVGGILGGAGALIVGGILLTSAPAFADNGPHVQVSGAASNIGTGGGCASCHRAHSAKADKFLTQASESVLCDSCHGTAGTGSTTNVQDGVLNGTGAALRAGGFTNAKLNASAAVRGAANGSMITYSGNSIGVLTTATTTTSKHNIGTAGTMWGNGSNSATANYGATNVTLQCSSCHDPHGNGNYRILKPTPQVTGSTAPIATVPTITDATTKTYTTTNYWTATDTNAPAFISSVSGWCSTCHTRYNSGVSGTGDAVFTYKHQSASGTQNSPNCIQCHVAHGSNATMSGTSADPAVDSPGASPNGDHGSKLLRVANRGICQMCHNK